MEAVKALALCHNVTPVTAEDDIGGGVTGPAAESVTSDASDIEGASPSSGSQITYQAASPDEVGPNFLRSHVPEGSSKSFQTNV